MEHAQALQGRLNEFAKAFSRAEIARKTGTSVMNVSRYLKGTRVPAEFCMALVREFGVNANWLLAGQGGPYVSDLATQHGQMAGNLLELVEAMSAVAKMRLGSIAGQDHMKLLRQLNESLGTYERLRAKLNAQGRGILSEVLRELQAALAAMDMARAGALRKAAEQVARLCDDDALALQLLGMQAHHSYLTGRVDESLQLMRKRFVNSISDGRISNEDQAQHALRLVVVLNDTGHVSEALALGRAFLELAAPQAANLPSVPSLGAFCAHILAATGRVTEALPVLQRWLALQQGRARDVSLAVLARAQLLAGVLTFDEALAAPGLPQPKHAHILGLACAMEHAPAIRACMKFMDSEAGREVKARLLAPHYGPLLARALERKDKSTLRELNARKAMSGTGKAALLELLVYETQLLRVLGNTKAAKRACAASETAIRETHEPELLDIALRATHLRNRMELEGVGREEVAALVAQGCRLLQPLLDYSPLKAARSR